MDGLYSGPDGRLPEPNTSSYDLPDYGKEHLMWCTEQQFDNVLQQLSPRGLLELIQLLQDAMLLEQATFDSLQQQLDSSSATDQHRHRLSAALCTSQARLTRLCGRSMRCFSQQALWARQQYQSGSEEADSSSESSRQQGASPHETSLHDARQTFPDVSERQQRQRAPRESGPSPPELRRQRRPPSGQDPTPPAPENVRQRRSTTSRTSASASSSSTSSTPRSASLAKQQKSPSADLPLLDPDPQEPEQEVTVAFKRNLSFFQQAAHRLHVRMSQSAAAAARRASSVDSDGSWSAGSSSDGRVSDGRPADDPADFGVGRFGGGVTSPSARVTSESARVTSESARSAAALGSGAAAEAARPGRSRQRPVGGGAVGATDGGRAFGTSAGSARLGGTAAERIRQIRRSREQLWEESSQLWETDSWEEEEEERPLLPDRVRSGTGFLPPKRRPRLHFPQEEGRRSCEDLTSFGRPSRPRSSDRPGDRRSGLTRARSCENGLSQPPTSFASPLRAGSVSTLVTGPGEDRGGGEFFLHRAPSVDEILESVKELRVRQQSGERMESSAEYQNVVLTPATQTNIRSNTFSSTKISIGSSGAASRQRVPPDSAQCYQNVWVSTTVNSRDCPEVIYDRPTNHGRKLAAPEHDQLYENVQWNGAPTYENITLPEDRPEYDVPRASRLYDSPRRVEEVAQDEEGDAESDWDEDSLDGDVVSRRDVLASESGEPGQERGGVSVHRTRRAPGLTVSPPPGQTSLLASAADRPEQQQQQQEQQQQEQQLEQQLDEQLDEGLGESDGRSHYNEDPGLEVIIEEAEEDYVTTSEEEDEGEEAGTVASRAPSLEGSEGIGSAEGDLRSNGSLERCSTLSSSGGLRSLDHDDDPEGPLQKDRSVDIYPETMRQRKHRKRPQQAEDPDSAGSQSRGTSTDATESQSPLQNLLPSVKALKNQFERSAGSQSGPGSWRSGHGSWRRGKGARNSLALDVLAASYGEPTPRTSDVTRPPAETVFDKFTAVDERSLRPRIATQNWDPCELLKVLYEVPQPSGRSHTSPLRFSNIEGWLEKLPSGMTKATFWNAWKRRYFKAKDGVLYYYQNNLTEKPSLVLRLMGGRVELMDCSSFGTNNGVPQTVFSLYDGVDRFMVVRCASGSEADRWHRALLTHTADDASSTYVQPVPVPPSPVSSRRRAVIDLGSTSVRAGLLLDQPTLPQLFFPAAVVTSPDGRHLAVGSAALRPSARAAGRLWYPLRAAAAGRRRLDAAAAAALIQLTLRRLQLGGAGGGAGGAGGSAGELSLVLSVPHGLRAAVLTQLAPLLLTELGVSALMVVEQSEAALAAYGAETGLVVNIGESTDVVPVIDGAVVPSGAQRVPYGGRRLQEHVRLFLLERRYSLVSSVESLLLRHALERLCFVSERYEEDVRRCAANPTPYERTLPVKHLLGDSSSWREIGLGLGRFQVPESLFKPQIWGLDQPALHELVQKAVEACPPESRRELLRTVCLSGGVTQLPGLPERLQSELDHLTSGPFSPRVHASAYRYHAAYLGAGVLAASDRFQQRAVTRATWRRHGAAAFDGPAA